MALPLSLCPKRLFFLLNTLYHLYRFDNPLAWLSTLSQNPLQLTQLRLQILLKRCWRDKRSLCELRKMHLSNVILYIDLCLYWNWNNMHKLFKLKARGPRIPQSRVRGQTERVRGRRREQEKYLGIGFAVFLVRFALFHSFCVTQMSKSNQKCTKFMAFLSLTLKLRHKFIIILFEPGSSVATHSRKRFRQPFCLCVRGQINKSRSERGGGKAKVAAARWQRTLPHTTEYSFAYASEK